MKRDFDQWLGQFRKSIADYKYYVDFNKVYGNVNNIKIELNILNSLIGSKNIEADFDNIYKKYPEVLKCIPILLAKRGYEIHAVDIDGAFIYNFKKLNYTVEQYKVFMRKTGLFDLLSNHIIKDLSDYVTGVEVGLDTNGRKNRGGDLMEDLVESFIVQEGYIKNQNYFKEMYLNEIEKRWGIDLSAISNKGDVAKRFDFVIKTDKTIYAIEANFYASSGSKLNETARSYKMITEEAKNIDGFAFVWFTDGEGWLDAKHNLKETFDVLDNLYNIKELEDGILPQIIK